MIDTDVLENTPRGLPVTHPTLPGEALRGDVTFDDVTSGEKTLIGRNTLLPVAHARTPPFQGKSFGVT